MKRLVSCLLMITLSATAVSPAYAKAAHKDFSEAADVMVSEALDSNTVFENNAGMIVIDASEGSVMAAANVTEGFESELMLRFLLIDTVLENLYLDNFITADSMSSYPDGSDTELSEEMIISTDDLLKAYLFTGRDEYEHELLYRITGRGVSGWLTAGIGKVAGDIRNKGFVNTHIRLAEGSYPSACDTCIYDLSYMFAKLLEYEWFYENIMKEKITIEYTTIYGAKAEREYENPFYSQTKKLVAGGYELCGVIGEDNGKNATRLIMLADSNGKGIIAAETGEISNDISRITKELLSVPADGEYLPDGETDATPVPEVTEKPEEVTPTPEVTEKPEEVTPTPEVTEKPEEVTPTPEVTGKPEEVTPTPEVTGKPEEVTPTPEVTGKPEEVTTTPEAAGKPEEVTPTPEAAGKPEEGADGETDFELPELTSQEMKVYKRLLKYGEVVLPTESNDARHQYIFGIDADVFTISNMPSGYKNSGEAKKKMISFDVPVWKIGSDGRKYSTTYNITVNKKVAANVYMLFQEIHELDIKFPIKVLKGYGYRRVGGVGLSNSTLMSIHSFGLAIDINPGDYDNDYFLGKGNDLRDKSNPYCIPDEVIEIFAKYGWYWGGNFEICADTMHFQYLGLDYLTYQGNSPFRTLDASKGVYTSGTDVKNLQMRLNEAGIRVFEDGVYGNNTAAAVKKFQKLYGLEVTGVVDYETWEKIVNMTHYMSYVF